MAEDALDGHLTIAQLALPKNVAEIAMHRGSMPR